MLADFELKDLDIPYGKDRTSAGNFMERIRKGVYWGAGDADWYLEQIGVMDSGWRAGQPFGHLARDWFTKQNAKFEADSNYIPPEKEREEFLKVIEAAGADYGLCDTVDQILERYPQIESDERPFVLTLVKHVKVPGDRGFRWHKNGQYIGTQEPQCESFGDEPLITEVLQWSLCELLPHAVIEVD